MHRAPSRRALALTAGLLASLTCASALAASTTFTKSQAATLARAVNLRSSDLPGYKSSPNPTTSSDVATGDKLAACAGGVPSSRDLVNTDSPTFTLGQQMISSGVEVLPLPSNVQQDLHAIRSARGQRCIRSLIGAALKQSQTGGVTFAAPKISLLSVPAQGTSGAFGLRLAATASEGSVHITAYVDLLGAAVGHAEVSLDAEGVSAPVSSATEQRLFGLLVRRADAAKH